MSETAESYEATVLANPAPMCSVEIASRAKGPPAITVKVYGATAAEAATLATAEYDKLVRLYAEPEAQL